VAVVNTAVAIGTGIVVGVIVGVVVTAVYVVRALSKGFRW
jgi:hypothetical protein